MNTLQNTRQNQTTPWYKHRWPWIIMAGPAIVVVAGFVTAWLAFTDGDSVVENNYYKVGLDVNHEIDQRNLARELGLKATALIADGKVHLSLEGLHRDAAPPSLQLRLVHPTRKGTDQTIELQRDTQAASGFAQFVGTLSETPGAGNWKAVLEDPVAGWRMDAVWHVDPAAYSPHLAFGSAAENQAKRQPIDLAPDALERFRQSQQQQATR